MIRGSPIKFNVGRSKKAISFVRREQGIVGDNTKLEVEYYISVMLHVEMNALFLTFNVIMAFCLLCVVCFIKKIHGNLFLSISYKKSC